MQKTAQELQYTFDSISVTFAEMNCSHFINVEANCWVMRNNKCTHKE